MTNLALALNHDQEWHEARRQGIGSSDAPVVVKGESHGRTAREVVQGVRDGKITMDALLPYM